MLMGKHACLFGPGHQMARATLKLFKRQHIIIHFALGGNAFTSLNCKMLK